MKIILGPKKHEIEFIFSIPENINKIGVTVSGGLDSTILSYLILKELNDTNKLNYVDLKFFTIIKNEGSTYYASRIIKQLNNLFPKIKINHINNCSNGNIWDGRATIGMMFIHSSNIVDLMYTGVNRQVDPSIKKFKNNLKICYKNENQWYKAPFLNMKKPNILDLYSKLGVKKLIPFTHTCTVDHLGKCGNCYSCEEREWAFLENGINDNEFIKPDIEDISFNGTWINNE